MIKGNANMGLGVGMGGEGKRVVFKKSGINITT